jgi:hypothetical protein
VLRAALVFFFTAIEASCQRKVLHGGFTAVQDDKIGEVINASINLLQSTLLGAPNPRHAA